MASTTAAAHYDSKADPDFKAEPPRTPLQTFHNEAKRILLSTVSGAPCMLDMACGRGGDIHKWRALRVGLTPSAALRAKPGVLGLDVSSESVQEAKARCVKSKYPWFDFDTADLTVPWTPPAEFDAASCFFALHYFFESKDTAQCFFENVAKALKPGGTFLCITASGRQVLERLKHADVLEDGVTRLEALWKGAPQCFGSGYTCSIQNTVTEGSSAPEYLVFKNVVFALAGQHGLEPLHDWGPGATKAFEGSGPWRILKPPYEDAAMVDCSRMYAAFVLRKSTGRSPVTSNP